ncbi:unnamed protein product, partial [Didymodactylos carnosus]
MAILQTTNDSTAWSAPFVTTQRPDQLRQSEEELEEFRIIWLDNDLNDKEKSVHIQIGLQTYVQTINQYRSIEQCYNDIRQMTKEKIFLIISGFLPPEKYLSDINRLQQVLCVYLFNSSSEEFPWIKQYRKLSEIDNISCLDERIRDDVGKYSNLFKSLEIDATKKPMKNLNIESRLFILHQLLTEVLLRLPKTEQSKTDFIEFCRGYFQNNQFMLQKVELVDNTYPHVTPIEWYTSPLFLLSSVVNKTCRTENIRLMFKVRIFMRDLYDQLKGLHQQMVDTITSPLTVFRGMIMMEEELKKLQNNIGGFVLTNSFLSTTHERDVAIAFSGEGKVPLGYVSVVFKIEIDAERNKSKPFGYLREETANKDEDEILLSIGMIFKCTAYRYEQ